MCGLSLGASGGKIVSHCLRRAMGREHTWREHWWLSTIYSLSSALTLHVFARDAAAGRPFRQACFSVRRAILWTSTRTRISVPKCEKVGSRYANGFGSWRRADLDQLIGILEHPCPLWVHGHALLWASATMPR